MDLHPEKVIGIVGGMGPLAGNALFGSIIRQTNACADQQHLSVVLMSFPGHIADRTSYLSGATSFNPAIPIVQIILKLELAGAGIIGLACNTSYSPPILQVIQDELDKTGSRVKLLNMPLETCRYIKENHRHVCRVGLMTTNGTYYSGIYKDLLLELGFEPIIPDFTFQNEVIHRMIYDPDFGIKANSKNISQEVKLLSDKAIRYFNEKKAEAIVLGCTELSLAITEEAVSGMHIVDSTEAMAKALIREATYYKKMEVDKKLSINVI